MCILVFESQAYLLDIRAVNKVGAGDAHEFQSPGCYLDRVDDLAMGNPWKQ
jgi:hypothetical protein